MIREYIVIESGPRSGRRVPVKSQLTIGRNPDSDLYLDDLKVSRSHAVIRQTPGGTVIQDSGSNNGTYVNDYRVKEHVLQPGDKLRIGAIELSYQQVEADTATPPGSSGIRFKDGRDTLESSAVESVYESFLHKPGKESTVDQISDAQQRLAAVYRANQIISAERDLPKLFEQVMAQIVALVPAHNGAIMLKDEESGELVADYAWSQSKDEGVVVSFTIVERALERNEAVITQDAAGDSRFSDGSSVIRGRITSAMCVPLRHQDESLGAIYVDSRGASAPFTSADLELLVALAGPASIAIKNARHEQMRERYINMLERAYDDTLVALADAIELRDHYTAGHTWRVSHFAVEMAKWLGWDKEQVDRASMGGVLHDVGKIAVDNAILAKPSALTDDEYEEMKIHPERGARILADIEFLKPLTPFCLYHHERPDGKGYPFGLEGEDIPPEGRLMGVADAFDAMTSRRPHRHSREPAEAIRIIEEGKGTQFDAQCADALIHCYNEGRLDHILQNRLEGEASIACPFCSTFIPVPDTITVGGIFECQVCYRRVRLCGGDGQYTGELVSQTGEVPSRLTGH